jgi:hypothetical protein
VAPAFCLLCLSLQLCSCACGPSLILAALTEHITCRGLCPVCFPAAVTLTGLIWTRYSTQITPINYNLMTVNAMMAVTGLYQLYRKFT